MARVLVSRPKPVLLDELGRGTQPYRARYPGHLLDRQGQPGHRILEHNQWTLTYVQASLPPQPAGVRAREEGTMRRRAVRLLTVTTAVAALMSALVLVAIPAAAAGQASGRS